MKTLMMVTSLLTGVFVAGTGCSYQKQTIQLSVNAGAKRPTYTISWEASTP